MLNIDKYKVKIDDLKKISNLSNFDFKSTKELVPLRGIIGQDRAVQAMNFGLKMKKKGYNIFVAGASGTGRASYTCSLIEQLAQNEKQTKDWVYVNNFKNTNEPIALYLEAGEGKNFKKDIEEIIEKLKEEVPKVFDSKEYEQNSRFLMEDLEKNIEAIIEELNKFAQTKGFRYQITERGLLSVPIKDDGTVMQEAEYGKLTPEQVMVIRESAMKLNQDSKDYLDKIKATEEDYKNKVQNLDKTVAKSIIDFYSHYLIAKYGKFEKIINYIKDLSDDIVENISKFRASQEQQGQQGPMALLGMFQQKDDAKFFNRYGVNLFIDNSETKCASVVRETNPTYYNLTGSIEYKNEIGALTTSFMEIKPGALHKANGGFLILNVRDLFSHPFAWEGLKRSLKTKKIAMESLNKQYGYIVTSTLKPEPIDLDTKVILIGDSYTYSILYTHDEDFRNLFKIMADFDIELERNEENLYKTAQFIASHCEEENLKHFDKSAVERIIEYSSRVSDNKEKLTARFNKIVDILYEADALSDSNKEYVTKEDVENAIKQKVYRNNKYEEKLNEMFEDGTLLIDISGEKIGQINGLAVMGTGEYSFGKPSKITASTYKGRHGIINVEREVKHSGSIHDKGVLILSGYLGERYGKEKPLSISTSITFEQNYSGIDGDSASSTELYVVISNIAQVPIKQHIAVTGSVSQKGEIQPIGGANEKIEGFFDVCKLKGLTGDQGAMIPIQNVKNLMLKDEVVEAVKEGKFHIYAISKIEEGLEILTGLTMDEIDKKVNEQLEKYRKFDKEDKEKEDKEDK